MFQLIRSFSTARIFAEFGIELFDGTLLNQCYDIMRHLGDVKVKETRRNTYIIDYNTETTDVKEIEHLSNDICKKIDIIKSEMKEFVNMAIEVLPSILQLVNLPKYIVATILGVPVVAVSLLLFVPKVISYFSKRF